MPGTRKSENKLALSYRAVKYFGKVFLLWPMHDNEKLLHWILREICWWLLMINGTFLITGIIIGAYYFYEDMETFTTLIFIVFEIAVLSESMYTSFLFKIQKERFKVLICFLEKHLININSPEEILFRQYLRKAAPLAICVYSIYGTLAVGFMYLQLFRPTVILPKEVWHPFPIESSLKQYVVLIQQMLYVYHTGVLHIGDGVMFMSMHIATAKLEVLSHELDKVVNEKQLGRCIEKHQEIIWFVNEINNACCSVILKTVLSVTFYLILGYLQLLHKHETYDPILVYQFFFMVAFVNYRMFSGAKCASDLSTMGDNLRFSVPWAGKTRGLAKSMNIIVHRCQKPLILSVTGIIPEFNLAYYSNFMSFTFSYFLTLKAILKL